MSGRRRFFPATPVQQVPGRTVALEMQLRPEAPEPVPAYGPVHGASWMLSSFASEMFWSPEDVQLEPLDDGRFRVSHPWGWEFLHTIWEGTPPRPDGPLLGVPGRRWRCVDAVCRSSGSVYFGVLLGDSTDVRWTLEWDMPADAPPALAADGWVVSAHGDRARADEAVVTVRLAGNEVSSGGSLSARAWRGGNPLAELRLSLGPPSMEW
ncbi:MAG: hypothetical protein Q4G71_03730 [Pseudomonadota bacterium]|nr:hypothetical protein [Pseudomonadota bacterium]